MSALVLRGRTVDCRQSDDGQEEIVLRWDTTQS
jgi:hypothetical protein